MGHADILLGCVYVCESQNMKRSGSSFSIWKTQNHLDVVHPAIENVSAALSSVLDLIGPTADAIFAIVDSFVPGVRFLHIVFHTMDRFLAG